MQAAGYLFVELYVVDLAHYKAVFRDALGFEVIEDDDDFVKLRSQHGTVLLNATTALPRSHPFADYRAHARRGDGVEIGFVTDDLGRARQASLAIPGCLVTEVTHQEWGMSDFRILSREGYFFRVTTPDPEP
jgi:catechol 2,3-dioxygenase-like lactoylglutathione lyase family enzyme